MRTHTEASLDGYGLFSMQGAELRAVPRHVDGVTILDLIGPLVREVSTHLPDRIRELLDIGMNDLALNLGEVPYADSCGVSGLVGAYNLVRQAGGRIRFFAAPERLLHTLRRLRLDTVLELYEDESSAVSSFQRRPPPDSHPRRSQ
jgi:anti-sigma B factor antagonist